MPPPPPPCAGAVCSDPQTPGGCTLTGSCPPGGCVDDGKFVSIKDRRRRNERIERELAFGTGVRFVRDDDDVLMRGKGADMDEMTATTEVIMSSMRRAYMRRTYVEPASS